MRGLIERRGVFATVLALGLFAMCARNVTDPDFWWHLRTGQLILQNHAAFHADPYSFTRFGQPWINHEWLSDVLIFSLYRMAGWGGLIVGFGAVTAAAFLLVFLRGAKHASTALLATVWAAFAAVPLWGARPQMFSLLLISIFLLILERSDDRPRLLWWLPPLLLLWVNLHAGYIAGLGLLLIFAAGDVLDLICGRAAGKQTAQPCKIRALALAACLVVVPLNPYGWKMFSYPFETLHSSAMQNHIAEWFSPDFHQAQYWPALLLIMGVIAVLPFSSRRLPSRDLLLLLTTMYMGLHSQRHLAIFSLVAAPILTRLVGGSGNEHESAFESLRSERSRSVRPRTFRRGFLNAAIVFALMIFAGLRVRQVIVRQPEAEAAHFPAAAVAFLMTNHPAATLFNDYDWGGYFIWKLYPEYRVYIDGRADLYGDAFMDQFAADYDCRADCGQSSLTAWGIRTVILPPRAPLAAALQASGSWRQAYTDSQAVILTKKLHGKDD